MSRGPGSARGSRSATTTAAGSSHGGLPLGDPLAGPIPGLLLAWKPVDVGATDRARIDDVLRVGRSAAQDWPVLDARLSKAHFEVRRTGVALVLRDVGSTNGTCLGGRPLEGPRALCDQDVIRAGRCVFVFQSDVRPIAAALELDPAADGLAGPFHSPALLAALGAAVRTGRHLLIEGESGVGKERVAGAVHRLVGRASPFLACNCARFSSPEEAETTLFGVVRGVFTGVDARPGLVELAEGGILYLDELHELAPRLQRSLLRLADGGEFNRVGDPAVRRVSTRLLLGTNRPVDAAVREGTLAHDLVARTHRFLVPPLASRRADVPAIFLAALAAAARGGGTPVEPLAALLSADLIEALLLDDFGGANVRFLEDLAATAVARTAPADAAQRKRELAALFSERLPDSPVLERHAGGAPETPAGGRRRISRYERHREAILEAYRACGGNLTAVEQALAAREITVHRRWLVVFLDRWGVRRRRNARSGQE